MITASIVTFHTRHRDLKRLIDCVMTSPIEVLYIIDNSSNDELRDFVKNNYKIHYIHSINLGYGSGHNIAIKKALDTQADYHIILNPDIYWNENVVEELLKYMDKNEDCGLIMPKVLYPDGKIQYLCKRLPSPFDIFARRFIPSKYQKKRNFLYEMHYTGYDKEWNCPLLSGCFMFLRTEILKDVGMFDPRFFMYFEDFDLMRRIHAKSKTIYYPYVSIIHCHAAEHRSNKRLFVESLRSAIRYFNKWGWFWDSERKKINKMALTNKFCE